MQKKLIALTCCIFFSLTGCGSSVETGASNTEEETNTTTSPPSSTDVPLDDTSASEGNQNGEAVGNDGVISPLSFDAMPDATTYDRHASFTISSAESLNGVQLECQLNDGDFKDCAAELFMGDVGGEGERTLTARIKNKTETEVSHSWKVLNIYDSGSIELLASSQQPAQADARSWRGILRINCDFSHSSYNDPIVFPGGEGMAHLHRFYGNELVDHTTTMKSLLTTGDATCQGGELNRSAYWVPALLAPDYDPQTKVRNVDAEGKPSWTVVPAVVGTNEEAHEVFYYSAAIDDIDAIQPVPAGLRMIAGTASTALGKTQDTSIVRWHCQSWESNDHSNPRWSSTIPECIAPDRVRMDVFFPSCWNGVDLDSSDHKSHMAYPEKNSAGKTACPTTHPMAIVRPSYHYAFGVTPDVYDPTTRSSKGWRLAADNYEVTEENHGGLSLHADWFNGWHPTVMEAILETCIKGGFDCHNGNLANGWRLSEAKEGTQIEPDIYNDGLGMHGHAMHEM